MVLHPHLEDDEFEPIRALCLQNLRSLEDDPGSKVIYELRRRHFPDPWGRPSPGTTEGVSSLTPEDLRRFPGGIVPTQRGDPGRGGRDRLAEASRLGRPAVRRLEGTARASRSWNVPPGRTAITSSARPSKFRLRSHTRRRPSPAPTTIGPAATAILGGYSSARLFTEVREKRGLCYSVYAAYEGQLERAAMLCYAARRPTGPRKRSTSCSTRSSGWASRVSRSKSSRRCGPASRAR